MTFKDEFLRLSINVKDGVFRQYRGSRDKDSFFSFVEEKKWQSLEPVSSWKSPQSFQMSFVAYVFKLSMLLRSLHNTIVQDYGIPYWGSYIIFGLSTILLGTLLGLMIVCCLDFVCIARGGRNEPSSKDPNFESKKQEKVCHLYGGIPDWGPHPVPSLHAYLPHGLHRRLAHAILHVPLVHGTRGCSSAHHIPDKLIKTLTMDWFVSSCNTVHAEEWV